MGQYDTVKINPAKLPISKELQEKIGKVVWNPHFQTKDLECYNFQFEITDDDELTVEILDQTVTLDKFDKEFIMYTSLGGGGRFNPDKSEYKWVEFIVKFEKGKLKSIIFDKDLYDNGKTW